MSRKTDRVEAITKKELVRAISKKTGFTQKNCSKALDAVIEVFAETILDGRAVPMLKFGRIEPYWKPERTLYKLDNETGIKLDENGEKVTYTFPKTRWVKFHMANFFKCKMNPGVYHFENVVMNDDDVTRDDD